MSKLLLITATLLAFAGVAHAAPEVSVVCETTEGTFGLTPGDDGLYRLFDGDWRYPFDLWYMEATFSRKNIWAKWKGYPLRVADTPEAKKQTRVYFRQGDSFSIDGKVVGKCHKK